LPAKTYSLAQDKAYDSQNAAEASESLREFQNGLLCRGEQINPATKVRRCAFLLLGWNRKLAEPLSGCGEAVAEDAW
jgi:hypothetical protein